ncbi:sensor histidine kinase [Paenibacillus yanchengensis]|uniref:Oxygen sensor histidine kinase NreB n=1 Tax=Paenibacillus yanchengensis TaxID=2035833 RepID=A0ABW4YR54_9BACL
MASKQQTNNTGQDNHAKIEHKRKYKETILWLLIIVGLALIVLQATGIIKVATLQGKWPIFSLIAAGVGLAGATIFSYFRNLRLKAALKKLMDQQKRRSTNVTLPGPDEDSGLDLEEQAAETLWKEQVKFTAVIEERQRLARELHDAVSQQLFAISMTATAVSRTIEKDWERAKRQVQLIEEMAAVAQSEMRALLLHLRPVHLDGKNLGQALHLLVEELKQKIPMNIILEVDENLSLLVEVEDHLFRIAQEALSNTLRHSKADQMIIKLLGYDNKVHLTIQDNGIGFDVDTKKQTSYGLLTMEERINELGGTLVIMSEPNEGTTIYLSVPLVSVGQVE